MFQSIKSYCDQLTAEMDKISADRKLLLDQLSSYIVNKRRENKEISLVYICTHNSRRSHFGQIWSHVASRYYGIQNVHTYSGGTEITAFNRNAINSLKRIGFEIGAETNNANPVYSVRFDEKEQPVICFSKVYDHPENPKNDFAAVMTCSEAEENCPFIPNVELRIGTTYDDPKAFDNTPLQDAKYDERCRQIALETFYVFSKINL